MRFAPAAAALAVLFAITSSVSNADPREIDPRAQVLVLEWRALLSAGETQAAIDAFEAAFAIDPAHTPIFVDLAEAARAEGLQGKAITYYREALDRDPDNFAAMSGEGQALVERGAVEQAQRNLARLESLCGVNCPETVALKARIDAGPPARLAAETEEDAPAAN